MGWLLKIVASRFLSGLNKLQQAKPADDVNSGKGEKPNLALGMSRVRRGPRSKTSRRCASGHAVSACDETYTCACPRLLGDSYFEITYITTDVPDVSDTGFLNKVPHNVLVSHPRVSSELMIFHGLSRMTTLVKHYSHANRSP